MRQNKVAKRNTRFLSNHRQTLGERIRWLRAKSKPYMTIKQLSTLSGVDIATISLVERGDPARLNVKLDTIRRLAYALDCQIFINIKRKPYPSSEECLPLGHTLPPLPKLKRKATERGHRLAEVYGSYPWKNYRQRKRRQSPKSTSDKSDYRDQPAAVGKDNE